MRRWFYWLGAASAVVLLAGGATVAVRSYARTSGVDGVVRGYFAALARGDAADALAFGDLPSGPHTLLTATVLAEQQRIAPLRNFKIVTIRRGGSSASADVSYTLAFRVRPVLVTGTVQLHQGNSGWRLDRVAIPSQLESTTARERQSIVGAAIPAGPTLMFPGALPIRLDSPYLQLDPGRDYVAFDTTGVTSVYVEVTAAGRSAAIAALRTKLRRCLSVGHDATCPLPSERYVPGSVHGTLASTEPKDVTVDIAADAVGTLRVHARATVTASYQRLNFRNERIPGRGRVQLDVHAVGYAVAPLALQWTLS